eukprot:830109-Ditylum_brightwellii.AAC.1
MTNVEQQHYLNDDQHSGHNGRTGSTNGPPDWALISDITLKVYHWMCKGCQRADPSRQLKVKSNADMLVDNATLLHNSN